MSRLHRAVTEKQQAVCINRPLPSTTPSCNNVAVLHLCKTASKMPLQHRDHIVPPYVSSTINTSCCLLEPCPPRQLGNPIRHFQQNCSRRFALNWIQCTDGGTGAFDPPLECCGCCSHLPFLAASRDSVSVEVQAAMTLLIKPRAKRL